jgi:hypothetical protein
LLAGVAWPSSTIASRLPTCTSVPDSRGRRR